VGKKELNLNQLPNYFTQTQTNCFINKSKLPQRFFHPFPLNSTPFNEVRTQPKFLCARFMIIEEDKL